MFMFHKQDVLGRKDSAVGMYTNWCSNTCTAALATGTVRSITWVSKYNICETQVYKGMLIHITLVSVRYPM